MQQTTRYSLQSSFKPSKYETHYIASNILIGEKLWGPTICETFFVMVNYYVNNILGFILLTSVKHVLCISLVVDTHDFVVEDFLDEMMLGPFGCQTIFGQ